MAKAIRIAVLLFVLATVAVGAWQTRSRTQSWQRTLDVVVYPVNGDRRETTAEYIGSLSSESFASIRDFMRREEFRTWHPKNWLMKSLVLRHLSSSFS